MGVGVGVGLGVGVGTSVGVGVGTSVGVGVGTSVGGVGLGVGVGVGLGVGVGATVDPSASGDPLITVSAALSLVSRRLAPPTPGRRSSEDDGGGASPGVPSTSSEAALPQDNVSTIVSVGPAQHDRAAGSAQSSAVGVVSSRRMGAVLVGQQHMRAWRDRPFVQVCLRVTVLPLAEA